MEYKSIAIIVGGRELAKILFCLKIFKFGESMAIVLIGSTSFYRRMCYVKVTRTHKGNSTIWVMLKMCENN